MKKLRLWAAASLAAVSAAACSTYEAEDRYRRADRLGGVGYSEQRYEENRYRVYYRTEYDRYRAEDFAMRRAAELTIERRYDWFQVLNRSRAVGDDMFGRYDRYTYGYDDPDWRNRPQDRPAYGDYEDDSVVILDVVMGNSPPPRAANVYEARRVLDYRYEGGAYNRS